jgi:hypothetical protein
MPRTRSTRDPGDSDLRSTYAAVIVVEVVVLIALWSFSAYFG